MIESETDVYASASLLYGLLITLILLYYSIDLSSYPSMEVFATYNSKTFSSMGYNLVDNEWSKKDSAQAKSKLLKVSKSISNPMIVVIKELEDLKDHFTDIKKVVMLFQESTSKVLDLGKSTNTEIGSIRLALDGFKQEDIKPFTRVFTRMDFLKSQVNSSNDILLFVSTTPTPPFLKMMKKIMINYFITCSRTSHTFWISGE